ncbi:non-ribosomal peptide synthetase [Chitinophaga sp. MD30]|uniref:non-ribosomal peptide synthetase n=2 Tax=Chitinophaga TaxID=79328 RepID=UPI000BB06733|nr:non-ribosomal peptide synthetase [Chitinophaga sp. MD30]ASZ13288.1 hypothetical protein CK934_21155 [Chitinophaga sp. MD30]
MQQQTTLITILEQASQRNTGITFISGSGEEKYLSYAALKKEATAALCYFRKLGVNKGDELIIRLERNDLLLKAFWGCLLGGIIPVPVSLGSQEGHKQKLFNIWNKLNHPFIIGEKDWKEDTGILAAGKDHEDVFSFMQSRYINASLLPDQGNAEAEDINPDDIAYIQFSSGSTGNPKGVALTHRNLLANMSDIAERSCTTGIDKALSWLPLTHDMGLICFHLTTLYTGIMQYLMPVNLFIRRPLIWMDKASEHQITQLYAPNFGYQYLLSALNNVGDAPAWKLHNVRIIYNGAEPINKMLCEEFAARMERYGLPGNTMYPGYGLAEACVAVTLPEPGEAVRFVALDRNYLQVGERVRNVVPGNNTQPVYFACVGKAVSNCRIKIGDIHGNILPDEHIGIIWIKGENVTKGYYNDAVVTNEVIDRENWLNTGDLGYLVNNTLVITGRKKNIIIINGQNYYPQDIEYFAQQAEGVRPGTVVACAAKERLNDQQQLIVFVQFKGKAADFRLLMMRIRDKIENAMNLLPDNIVPVKTIPKTTSGKIQHYLLVEAYQQGAFDQQLMEIERLHPITADQGVDECWQKLVIIVADLLNTVPKLIGPDVDLFAGGLNSLKAIKLISRLEREGYHLTPKEVFENTTVGKLHQRLANEVPGQTVAGINVSPDYHHYRLSRGQLRFWLLEQVQPGNAAANIVSVNKIAGKFDYSSFNNAFKELVRRHESLRTVFRQQDTAVVQVVLPFEEICFEVAYTDLSKSPDGRQQAVEYAHTQSRQPFDLEQGPLLRVSLLQLSASEYVFILVIHHIVSDGWSIEVLSRELRTLYHIYRNGGALPSLPRLQYKDYLHWRSDRFQAGAGAGSVDYWQRQLSGPLPVLDLPVLHNGAAATWLRGHIICRRLPAPVWKGLKQLSESGHQTVFTTLMSVMALQLYRYTGQEDLVISTDTAGRYHRDLEDQIGYYLQLLPIRIRLSGGMSFMELQQQVQSLLLDAYDHQEFSDEALEGLSVAPGTGRSPLFDLLFLYQQFDQAHGFALELPDVDVTAVDIDNGSSLTPLQLECWPRGEELELKLRYNSDMFGVLQMESLLDHFVNLCSGVLSSPDASLSFYDLLGEGERALLSGFNATSVSYDTGYTDISSLLSAQCYEWGDRTALVYEGACWSYAELGDQVTRLSHRLQSDCQVRVGALIGLLSDRSPLQIIAMLGILKAGCAYVPLDGSYPSSRIDYMISDSGLTTLLVPDDQYDHYSVTVQDRCQVFAISPLLSARVRDEVIVTPAISGDMLAYVMYTSGSTGHPKGVMISHASLLDYVYTFRNYFELRPDDVVIQQSSLSFDTAVEEIYPVLSVGGRLVLLRGGGADVDGLSAAIEEEQVTLLSTTPLVLDALRGYTSRLASLRIAISGGDQLQRSHISHMPAHVRLYNSYGPTESTVCASYHRIEDLSEAGIIGRPIANRQVYVLDGALREQPVGIIGELYLGGKGLSLGYYGRPSLTAARFIAHPDGTGLLYRSGDYGRWRADGTLEFTGRADDQLKIHGYRVEPGEVAYMLSQYEGIAQVEVIGLRLGEGSRLAAYYTSSVPLSASSLRSWLSHRVPSYMVPTYFVELPQLPMTAHGKVARDLLPAPGDTILQSYVAPSTATERLLSAIWSEVLGVATISVTDNFFELGGQSLKAMQVLTRLYQQHGVKQGLGEMFSYPDLRSQAAAASQQQQDIHVSIPLAPFQSHYPLSPAQRRLWILEQMHSGTVALNLSWLCQLNDLKEGSFDYSSFNNAFKELVRRHESLRTVFRQQDTAVVQVVLPFEEICFEVAYTDLSKSPDGRQQAVEYAHTQSRQPFDLEQGPLLRVSLLQLSASEYVFILVIHHIVSDGWSIEVLSRELRTLYHIYRNGGALPSLPRLQYKDYLHWRSDRFQAGAGAGSVDYWQRQLSGPLPVLDLPVLHNGAAATWLRGHIICRRLPAPVWKGLKQLSESGHQTVFTTLMSVMALQLYRYTGQEDLVISTDTAGRYHRDLEDQIGYYLQLLPIRIRLSGGMSFMELQQQVQSLLLDAYDHQEFSDEALEGLSVAPGTGRSPLFDLLFLYQQFDQAHGFALELPDVDVTAVDIDNGSSLTPLQLECWPRGEELELKLRYNSDMFGVLQMESLLDHFVNLCSGVLSSPDASLSFYDLLGEGERALLSGFNATSVSYDTGYTDISSLLSAQCYEWGDRTALVYEGACWSYAELGDQVTRLSHRLQSDCQVRVGALIGLLSDRSPLQIIAMLGILKAGCAYVPLDGSYPSSRIDYMISDSGLTTLLVPDDQYDHYSVTVQDRCQVFAISPLLSARVRDEVIVTPAISGDMLAYVMYTSGSTGHPKGVMISHASLLDYVYTFRNYFELRPDDVVIQQSSLSFDTAVEEIYPVLSVGGRLVLLRGGGADVDGLSAAIEEEQVTLLSTTPLVLDALRGYTSRLASLRIAISGGDQLQRSHISHMPAHVRLYNSYGPTESTVCASYHRIEDLSEAGI